MVSKTIRATVTPQKVVGEHRSETWLAMLRTIRVTSLVLRTSQIPLPRCWFDSGMQVVHQLHLFYHLIGRVEVLENQANVHQEIGHTFGCSLSPFPCLVSDSGLEVDPTKTTPERPREVQCCQLHGNFSESGKF